MRKTSTSSLTSLQHFPDEFCTELLEQLHPQSMIQIHEKKKYTEHRLFRILLEIFSSKNLMLLFQISFTGLPVAMSTI